MEKNKKMLSYHIIGSAIIWAVTMLGCASILKEAFIQISFLLTSAAAVHLIIIWSSFAAKLKK